MGHSLVDALAQGDTQRVVTVLHDYELVPRHHFRADLRPSELAGEE